MEKTDCREPLEVHRNVIDVESIVFLMILLAPEVSFVTLHMRWHKGCFPKASTKKNITRYLEDMNFTFSWQEQYPTRSRENFLTLIFFLKILPLKDDELVTSER